MRLALIPPTSLLGYTEATDYQLALPHMLDSDGRYREWYRYLGLHPNQYVILDNGEAEGENKYPARYLLDIAEEYKFDEVVAHDVLFDAAQTIRQTKRFLQAAAEYYKYKDKRPKIGIVAQGKTMDEVKGVISELAPRDLVDVIYLPRHLVTTITNDARIQLAYWIAQSPYDLEVHCLGTNPAWIEEVSYLAGIPNVRGVDTSAPFNYAFAGMLDYSTAVKRPENYFEWPMQSFGHPLVAADLVDDLMRMAHAA